MTGRGSTRAGPDRTTAARGAGRPVLSLVLMISLAMAGCATAVDSAPVCTAAVSRPAGVLVAGSGAAIPLARALASRYDGPAGPGGPAIVVAESIGTGGALRALGDRAIDIGLASRPLAPREAAGLEVALLADAPIVIAARGKQPRSITWELLLSIAAGRQSTWPDGTPAVVVLREPGDSGLRVIGDTTPELAEAFEAARATGAGLVAYTDTEALELLDTIPGAFGIVDRAALGLASVDATPLRVIDAPPEAAAWLRLLRSLRGRTGDDPRGRICPSVIPPVA